MAAREEMKDITGRVIQAGDRVLYAKHCGEATAELRLGTVLGRTPSGCIQIESESYRYNAKLGKYAPVPCKVSMGHKGRCLVVAADFKMEDKTNG